MRLSEIIVRSAEAALALQQPDGSFPPGWNGPYRDTETPVRNTAHWLLTLIHAHQQSGASAFGEAAARAAEYLMRPETRRQGGSFLCRESPLKDTCNGVIGQAWVIEALVAAGRHFGDARYEDLARTVFLSHAFDEELGLWRCWLADATNGPIDRTFNHQLWFAAAGALVDPDPRGQAGSRVIRFLDQVAEWAFRVDTNGRIHHKIRLPRRNRTAGARSTLPGPQADPARTLRQELGYHAFNLYAFALIKQHIPVHPLWDAPPLRAALAFARTDEHVNGLDESEFAYPYNPVGFEMAFALQVFPEPAAAAGAGADYWWVERQLERTFDWLTLSSSRGTTDPVTCAARLYEATRVGDLGVRVSPRPLIRSGA